MKRWQTKPLRALCDLVHERASEGAAPYLEIGNLDPKTKEYGFSDKPAVKGALIAKAGDLIVSRVRPTRGAITLLAENRLAVSSAFTVFRPRHEISGRFLFFTLAWNDVFLAYLGKQSKGALYPTVSEQDVSAFEVPVPPLVEQERIVKLMDEADTLRKLRAQADRRAGALTQALFHEMFGDPATNSMGWETGVLGDVVHGAKDGPHVSPKYTESGVPFLSARHVRAGRIIWQDLKYLSHEDAELHWKKCRPQKGDVLYTKGGTTGLAAAVNIDTPFAIWVHIALLKTNHGRVDPIWLENMLNTQFCYEQSQNLTHGITNKDLGLTRMVKINIYIPPLPLQREFASQVAEIRAVESEQAASRLRMDALFQSMLHNAFCGEL